MRILIIGGTQFIGKAIARDAAAAGHDKIVKLIVDSGADVRIKDKNDDTALEYAEKNNRPKVKELLNLYACEYTW